MYRLICGLTLHFPSQLQCAVEFSLGGFSFPALQRRGSVQGEMWPKKICTIFNRDSFINAGTQHTGAGSFIILYVIYEKSMILKVYVGLSFYIAIVIIPPLCATCMVSISTCSCGVSTCKYQKHWSQESVLHHFQHEYFKFHFFLYDYNTYNREKVSQFECKVYSLDCHLQISSCVCKYFPKRMLLPLRYANTCTCVHWLLPWRPEHFHSQQPGEQ